MKSRLKICVHPLLRQPVVLFAAIALAVGAGGCGQQTQEGNPLFDALSRGSAADVQRLARQDPSLLNRRGPAGETALYKAAFWGRPDLAAPLIQSGADLNAADDFGRAPLSQAVFFDHPEIVELLLKAGARPDSHDQFGVTPLHQAIAMHEERIVALLRRYGARE